MFNNRLDGVQGRLVVGMMVVPFVERLTVNIFSFDLNLKSGLDTVCHINIAIQNASGLLRTYLAGTRVRSQEQHP